MKVVWDNAKNLANRKKHGLSFEEAAALFVGGVPHLDYYDEAHSDDEERHIAVGPIARGLVTIVYTSRDEEIRIISARQATRHEADLYHEDMGGRS